MELGIKTLPTYQVRLGKKLLRECKTSTEAALTEMVRWACTRATGDVGGMLPVVKKSGGCCAGSSSGGCGTKSSKKKSGGCCNGGSCGSKKASAGDHGHGHGHAAAASSSSSSSSSSDHRWVLRRGVFVRFSRAHSSHLSFSLFTTPATATAMATPRPQTRQQSQSARPEGAAPEVARLVDATRRRSFF